jgi:hypothetical protein
MAKEDQSKTTDPLLNIRGVLTVRFGYPDGRISTLITWPDGEWKVEIFANIEHALGFAEKNELELSDARDN